ncbi:aspartate aminotransferase family protein [Mycolicibacterium neoaurum]|uniref:4-aminobutyrate aminotransferase n=2 Tax=Mycobacteriaceae TaxID=1762 RepID=V5XDP4_MYCNE|nr:4-aminobutyrate aminotransferase [Mycolicibacterium neoaurum]KUM07927.1 4-aminobutyrate aminotransferase [Mycolicibacterium neoaurum]
MTTTGNKTDTGVPAAMPNAFDPASAASLKPALRSLVERRQNVIAPSNRLFYSTPVDVVRAEGVHLFDTEGNEYLDAYNNVPAVGHCNPHVVEAISRQAGILNSNTRYLTPTLVDYSERLLATHHPAIDQVLYTCSGSEANDLAIRMARYETGGDAVIVTSNAYHGLTASIAEISPTLGPNVPLGAKTLTIDAPDYATDEDAETVGAKMASRVAEAIAHLERHGMRLAAMLVDTVFSSDGLITGPAGFLGPVVDVVHAAGGFFIADEVQAGFGRTGEAMWGYQRHGITPDLVTMGKPMANGLPLAAVATQSEHAARFGRDIRYFNTSAGNSVCISAANAMLDVFENDDILGNVRAVGRRMLDGLTELTRRHACATTARGAGLFVAVDLVDPETGDPAPQLAAFVVNGLRERRILVSNTGPFENVLKIRPPLVFSPQNAQHFLQELDAVLAEATS